MSVLLYKSNTHHYTMTCKLKITIRTLIICSYLKGAKEGDEVTIDARTVRAGKRLAFLECELKHKKDGSIIAKASHTLFIGQ